jgi:sortase B
MFNGAPNPAGAIFMDYRCDDGFNAPVCLIYGHNMRDGSMFSPLTDYLKQNFLEAHPEIIIFTANGETLIYRIAEVRRTDAWDDVYSLDFNDIPDADRLLILSTCLDNADRSSRLLVFAVLEGL